MTAKDEPKSFLARMKEAIEHGKTASLFVGLLLSAGLGLYQLVAPEKEARGAYRTLKPVVEQSANEIRDLKARLDMQTMLLMTTCTRPTATIVEQPVAPQPVGQKKVTLRPPGPPSSSQEPLEPMGLDVMLQIADDRAAMSSSKLVLPDEPWAEQKKK